MNLILLFVNLSKSFFKSDCDFVFLMSLKSKEGIIMGVPRMFKLPKHKKFEYSPLYYDERKEQLEKIKQKYDYNESEGGKESSEYRPNIKGQMRSHFNKNSGKSQKASNIRLIIIILGLLAITYYLFQ